MTVEYHINERDELITLTAQGPISGSEACVCIDELLNDPAFDPSLPQLIDLREAQPSGTEQDLQRFETFLLGDYRPRLNASVAIVVNAQWDEETCAKAFLISCALGSSELFDGWNQACKWLIQKEFSANLTDLDALTDDPEDPLSDQEAVDGLAHAEPLQTHDAGTTATERATATPPD